jgi:deoxyribodipyrimidine photolyase-related protein
LKRAISEAGEWRVQAELEQSSDAFGIDVDVRSDERFLCSYGEFETWAKDRTVLTMKYFYREELFLP